MRQTCGCEENKSWNVVPIGLFDEHYLLIRNRRGVHSQLKQTYPKFRVGSSKKCGSMLNL